MRFEIIRKSYKPLSITFFVKGDYDNELVLFLWEDPINKNYRYSDIISITKNNEYYSSLNKDINFFENGVEFKIISLKNYNVLYSYEFKNISFIEGNNILYISQNGYNGYSYCARNYIHQLLDCGYNIQWFPKFSNSYKPDNEFEKKVFECQHNLLDYYDSVIIHHTPESWDDTLKDFKFKKSYGLTTWETTNLCLDWKKYINDSYIDELTLPSKFNIDVFRKSDINKKINLWRYDIFPIRKSNIDVKEFYNKCYYYNNGFCKDVNDIIDVEKTLYYNISQFINRKNILQLLETFCIKFKNTDKVCLFLKINLENYTNRETEYIKYKLNTILKKYNNLPDIIFCFDRLSEGEINYIHEIGDVYYTLNLGEGFGLCTYTAKKYGNKVICGKFGAECEYLDNNDILLNYQLQSADILDDFNKYYIGNNQQCAMYDTDYVVNKLQYCKKSIKNI